MFVAKFDAAGKHLWSQRFGDIGSYAIAVDRADNVLVTGSFEGTVDFGGGTLTSAGFSDIFVAKIATIDPRPSFLRGDCDSSGTISIADAFKILSYRFQGEHVDCVDACDADGIGGPSIADAFFILTHKFLGGPAPSPVFATCP